jgi:hypothetical protein
MTISVYEYGLRMVPQWLEMALGVKRALGILFLNRSDGLIWNLAPYVVMARLPPLSLLLCYLDNRSAVCVMLHNTQHSNASLRKAPIW